MSWSSRAWDIASSAGLPEEELHHAERREGVGLGRGVDDPVRLIDRSSRVLRRRGKIALVDVDPREVQVDPGQELGVVARLGQRSLERVTNAAFEVHPAHRRESEQELRSPRTGRRGGGCFFEQGDGTRRVAGIEVILGGVHASPSEPLLVLEGCELPSELPQSGGGVGGSPCASVPGRVFERLRHVRVRTRGRQCEVASPLLDVEDQLRQPAVKAALRLC